MLLSQKISNVCLIKELFIFFLIFLLSISLIHGLVHGILVALNILMLLKLYRSSKTFTMFLYFFMCIVMYVLPVLFHGYIYYFYPMEIRFDYNYIYALIYVLIFNVVLYISYHFFSKNLFQKPISIFRQGEVSKPQAILGSFLFMFLSLASEFYLIYMGKTAAQHGEITKFTEIATLFISLKIASVLLIGFYIKQHNSRDMLVHLIYYSFIIICLIFAIKSGSRAEPIILLLGLGYIHIEIIKRNKIAFLILIVFLMPIITMMFPFLMIYRNNVSLGIINVYMGVVDGSLLPWYVDRYSFIYTVADIILDRMNLIGVIQRVIETGLENFVYHSDYVQNITNIIPRILWEGKPHAGIDGNSLGHELDLIHSKDKNTSVGLTVIGESFYQLRYYGLFIAIFQGAIFSFFDKKLAPINASAFILYFIMVINIVTTGVYLYIIPKIIKIFIIYLLVMFPIGFLKVKPKF